MNSNHKTALLTTLPALPVDVIVEILCRLPVKSLLRFRCLSKQIRSIIDGPDFINRHLQNHSSDQRLIVHGKSSIFESDLFSVGQSSIFQSDLLSVDFDSANNVFKLEHPFESWGFDYTLIGSCNGLLALSHRHGISVGLWNISTKKHQILPKFWTDFDVPPKTFHMSKYVFDGFGYDGTTDDYKWVRVIHFDEKRFTEVTVYCLKTNSWRRIEDVPPYHNYLVTQIGVLVGGALNWVVEIIDEAGGYTKWRVLSFDLKGEKFCQVSVPDVADEDVYFFEVVLFRGCLCLGCSYPLQDVLDIWVMKEYRVKESWTKLFSFGAENSGRVDFAAGTRALTYSRRGDNALFYQVDGEVFWYDSETEREESVEINEWTEFISRAAIYIDSLVPPVINM